MVENLQWQGPRSILACRLRLCCIETGSRLNEAVEPSLSRPRTGSPISRVRDDHDSRRDPGQLLRAETTCGEYAGPVRLKKDVGLLGQVAQALQIFPR